MAALCEGGTTRLVAMGLIVVDDEVGSMVIAVVDSEFRGGADGEKMGVAEGLGLEATEKGLGGSDWELSLLDGVAWADSVASGGGAA